MNEDSKKEIKTIEEGERFRFVRRERTGPADNQRSVNKTECEASIYWTMDGWKVNTNEIGKEEKKDEEKNV